MRLSPPKIYQAFIIAMVGVYLLAPQTRWLQFPLNLLGLPVFIGGAWLALAAKRQFQSQDTSLAIDSRPARLHTGGFYRYSRNPMYLGIAIGLLGLALLLSSWLNLAFPLAFVLVMDRFYVRREERLLTECFPQEYREYCKDVRRWV